MKTHTRVSSVTIDRKQLNLASLILVTINDGVTEQVYSATWTDYTKTAIQCTLLQQTAVIDINDVYIW